MSTASAGELVRRYLSAYETKDRTLLENLLSDTFTFTSPLDDHIGKQVYFERCWPNSQKIRRFRIERLFETGREAFVLYELEPTEGDRFRNTEFFRTDGDRILEVEVYFGSLPEGN